MPEPAGSGGSVPRLLERLAAGLGGGSSSGPIWLASGLVFTGGAAYGYLALAGRALGPERFASLGVLWTMINIIGPGLFAPMELEMSRGISHLRGLGLGARPLFTQALKASGVLLAVIGAVLLVLSPPLRGRLYDGSWWLLLWTFLATAFIALGSLSRGVFASTGHLRRYGVQLYVDGGLRVVLAAVALLLGARSADTFGFLLVLALAVAVAVTFPGPRPFLDDGPPAPVRELTTRLGLLLGTSMLSYALVNSGPILVKLLSGPDQREAAGVFLSGLQIARVPLFLFVAVSVVMLPRLSATYAVGDLAGFRRFLARVLVVVTAFGLLGVAGSGAVGPWLVRLLFGPSFVLGRSDLILLALGSALYMLGMALSQALIAVESHAACLGGWAAGVLGLGVVTAAVPGLQSRVEWGFVAGCGVAGLTMAYLLRDRLADVARDRPPDAVPTGQEGTGARWQEGTGARRQEGTGAPQQEDMGRADQRGAGRS